VNCITTALLRSTQEQAGASIALLFDLASGGVFHAINITIYAVRSYRTISPLPSYNGGIFSVALSIGSHLPGVTWRLAP